MCIQPIAELRQHSFSDQKGREFPLSLSPPLPMFLSVHLCLSLSLSLSPVCILAPDPDYSVHQIYLPDKVNIK